ncbi:hypothetical protein ACFQ3S_16210 [Mucilaginibacter terrae]|uniref:hypothetical protein n=1 Tax=Mucilaginibacter terrae TaxID=1955052 RepID=UPI00363C791E
MKNLTIILLLLTGLCTAKAQTQSADRGIMMLAEFYKTYISVSSDREIDLNVMEAKLAALKRRYCTEACQKQIVKLTTETDADPIIKAQDSYKELLKTLVIKKDNKNPKRYLVTYVDIAGSRYKTTIYVTLAAQNKNLKIAYLE